jgi:hypothetical protein
MILVEIAVRAKMPTFGTATLPRNRGKNEFPEARKTSHRLGAAKSMVPPVIYRWKPT